jgi:hypothetical protein
MKSLQALFLAGLLSAVCPIRANAEQPALTKRVDLKWNDLAMFLVGGHIKVPLSDGTILQGEALSFTPSEMVMLVAKTSDAAAHPNGRQALPRAAVKTIELTRIKGAGGRVGFTILGIVGGLAAGTVIALASEDSGDSTAAAAALALPIGGGVAGYFGGRAFDRRTTYIRVLPD